MNSTCGRIAMLGLCLSVLTSPPLHAQTAEVINYRGQMTPAGGTNAPIAVPVTFTLYTAPTSGTPLYTETQAIAPDTNGVFAAWIGASNAVPGALFTAMTNYPLYIEVRLGDQPPAPRERLASISFGLTNLPPYLMTSARGPGSAIHEARNTAFNTPGATAVTEIRQPNLATNAANLELAGPGMKELGSFRRQLSRLLFPSTNQTGRVAAKKTSTWKRTVTIGGRMYRGENTIKGIRIGLGVEKTTAADNYLRLSGNYAYSSQNHQPSVDQGNIIFDYGHTITNRAYVKLTGMWEYDHQQLLDYRWSVGPVFGYYFIRTPRTEFNLEAAPSYVREKVNSQLHTYPGMRMRNGFSFLITPRLKLYETTDYLPSLLDQNNFTIAAEGGLKLKIDNNFELLWYVNNKYVNLPLGDTPQNYTEYVTSLKWTF